MSDFLKISEGRMFTSDVREKGSLSEFVHFPLWFSKVGVRSIAEWLVSHFEIRILRLFGKKIRKSRQ